MCIRDRTGSCLGICDLKSCAVVDFGSDTVNGQGILVAAVVDLKNKAAVGNNNAGEDAVVSNGEALASLRLDGDGCAGGCGNSLGLCCAVLSVKTCLLYTSIRPRNLYNFIAMQLVGTALAAVRYRRSRYRVIAIVNC